jgi:hypothetical protein
MKDFYPVRIYESELRVIGDETLDFPRIETGGNLFGSLTHGRAPVVWLATRPAGKFSRRETSLELDHKLQRDIEAMAWRQFGIQSLGMWHSHHQIGLYEPSEGDRHRTANYAVKAERKFYVEILCNLPRAEGERRGRDSEKDRSAGPVIMTPFVYMDAPKLERAAAEITVLPGISPLRAALEGISQRGPLADALRSATEAADIRIKLRPSGADRAVSPAAAAEAAAPPPAETSEPAAPSAQRAPGILQQTAQALAHVKRGRDDARSQPARIPDAAHYAEKHVTPLIEAVPDLESTLEVLDDKRLALRVWDERHGGRELLMVFGWDGAAPVTLSCSILDGGQAVKFPASMPADDIVGHFSWGVKQIRRGWT